MIYRMNRRDFVLGGLGGLVTAPMLVQNRRQRVIVFLVDGLGAEYISASDMPVLKSCDVVMFTPSTFIVGTRFTP